MVHIYKNNGYNIAIDTASGAIHVLDDLSYDILEHVVSAGSGVSPEEFFNSDNPDMGCPDSPLAREAFLELKSLYDEGQLFSKDSFRPHVERFLEHPTVIKAACLNVAHDCNLSCKYCFAGEGEYHGERGLMSLECGKRALEFLVENSGARKNLEVDFFGGEPMLCFETVKELVAYGRKITQGKDKHFRFTLTTNAMIMEDDFIEFAQLELDNVVLSIDGRKSVHDKMRPDRGGNGSYDRIMPNIQKFSRTRGNKKHYIRGTFTKLNKDFSEDILHLANQGFKEISMEPVVAKPTEEYAITESDVPELLAEYDRLAAEMAKRQGTPEQFSFFHFNIDLTGGPCVYKRLSGCGAGSEYVAIAPNGDIYPCHQFVGLPEFLLGNVYTGIENKDIISRFKAVNVYTKPQCRDCFAAMYCSGGCMANAYNASGDIGAVYETGCQLERKRIECAIMLEVHKRVNNQHP